MKRILNVILYTTIRVTGVAGVIWFFVSSAATLELVINGADMTTWEKDPYIECLEWLIAHNWIGHEPITIEFLFFFLVSFTNQNTFKVIEV